jgi:hypothetical protein
MNASKSSASPEPPADQGPKDAKRSRHSEGTTDDDMDASYQVTASGLAGKGKEREEPESDEEDSDDDISDGPGKDDARGGIKQLPPPAGQSGPACWRPRCLGCATTRLCLGLSPGPQRASMRLVHPDRLMTVAQPIRQQRRWRGSPPPRCNSTAQLNSCMCSVRSLTGPVPRRCAQPKLIQPPYS